MENNIERAYQSLGRTQKSKFISEHIELSSSKAIANFVKSYLFDGLKM